MKHLHKHSVDTVVVKLRSICNELFYTSIILLHPITPKTVGYKFLLFERFISTALNYPICFQKGKKEGHSEDGVWRRG